MMSQGALPTHEYDGDFVNRLVDHKKHPHLNSRIVWSTVDFLKIL